MIKVLHILNTGSYSGAENVAIQIINGTRKECKSIYMAIEGPISRVLEKEDIEYALVSKLNSFNIRKVVKTYKPDLIHAHDYKATVYSSLAFVDVPIISHLHNNPPWIQTFNSKTILFYIINWRIKTIFGVSESVINEHIYSKMLKPKSMIIGNPVCGSNLRDMVSLQGEKIYDLIFLGRLVKVKNPHRFINIVSLLQREHPQIKVAIVGDGELMDSIKKEIAIKNISQNVTIFGFLENPYNVLNCSKILCLTSDWEGFGLVAIEALSFGIPVVTTQVGGLVNIVTPDCGKICNRDEEFIEEISLLLTNSDYYITKKENALIRSNELDNKDKYMKKIIDVYNSILNNTSDNGNDG